MLERGLFFYKGAREVKQSLAFISTIHEVPSNNNPIHPNELLVHAGYIHMKNGKYISLLPLGKRVLQKMEKIIREELNTISTNEITLPILNSLSESPSELDDQELFHWKNTKKEELYLASSHVEILTSIVKEKIHSYKQLPFVLYQIQNKYRNEIHENGMFKNKEFQMLDVYSFHHTSEQLDEFYEKIDQVYTSIFRRLGLPYKKVVADLGGYPGQLSHEYIVLSENGDATIACSNESDYVVNVDLAEVPMITPSNRCDMKELIKQEVSNSKLSIDNLLHNLDTTADQMIKAKIIQANDELIVVLYRGDHTLNEVKLKNKLNVPKIKYAKEKTVREVIGCSSNYVGPIKLPVNVKVVADYGIKTICNGITFANEDGYYYSNVNPERDFAINAYEDLRYIQEGDPSPDGVGEIQFSKGYEIAHIYKLGSSFSEKFETNFIDEDGKSNPIQMGIYEIGVSRLFAVATEIYQDDKGIAWPNSIAPFDVHLLTESVEDEEQWMISEQLYHVLLSYQFDVLFDDRDTPFDVKLKDANLIGIPVQVIIGNNAIQGNVKVIYRRTGESFECAKEELMDRLSEFFRVY